MSPAKRIRVTRFPENPIITTRDVKPSRPDFEVIGAFNAGVAKYGDETLLLLRVAERPVQNDPNHVLVPVLHEATNELTIKKIPRNDPGLDLSDPRGISANGRSIYLTSMSHLRLARSKDGRKFIVEETPAVFPQTPMEAWGIEDPRITPINDTFYITYTSVSAKGVAVGLMATKDFQTYERKGLILPPENKDVILFPEKINGKYYLLHRPVPRGIGDPEMWIAESPDLLHWGNHRHLISIREGVWDSIRIGGGAVPIKTERGWLELYHGADKNHCYCMGALLLDLEDPGKVIARSEEPFLVPEADYEVHGFFGRVVFSCGAIREGDIIRMYYGASDEMMACAEIPLEDIFNTLQPV
ncbi:glycoside hydrolase family 130 protein [Bacillaceae bacterium]